MYFYLKEKQLIIRKKYKWLIHGIKHADHIVKVDQDSHEAEMTNTWSFKVLEA